IVGFPGETEAEFERTLHAARAVGYAAAFSFKYSRRPGTPAADAPDQVDEDVKTERLLRLQDLLWSQQDAFNAATVGRVVPVLFEKAGRHGGQMIGRSPWLQSVHCEAPDALLGRIAEVEIVAAARNSVTGRLAAGLPAVGRDAAA